MAAALLHAAGALSHAERGTAAVSLQRPVISKGRLGELEQLSREQLTPHPMVRGSERLLRDGVSAALAGTGCRYRRVRELESAYEDLGVLGRGSYGCVIRCRPVAGGTEVAVKTLDLQQTLRSRRSLARVLYEVAALSSLSHPALPPLREVCDDGECLHLVMELCTGQPLSALRHCQRIARPAGAQLLGALAYIHRQGVIHRDVKPANVMWENAGGKLKLLDFTFAKYIPIAEREVAVPTTPMCLTVQAASFEAVARLVEYERTKSASSPIVAAHALERGDVYGAGWCLLYLLAGAATEALQPTLFAERATAVAVLEAKRAAPRFADEDCGAVPPLAQALVTALMDPDPGERPSAAEAVEHPWLTGSDTVLGASPQEDMPKPPAAQLGAPPHRLPPPTAPVPLAR